MKARLDLQGSDGYSMLGKDSQKLVFSKKRGGFDLEFPLFFPKL